MRTNRTVTRWFSRATLLLAGVALAGSASLLLASPSTQPSADEIISKYIEITGGKAAYQKVKTRVAHGKIAVPAQGMTGTINLYFKSPNMVRVDAEIPGVETSEEVFDGTHGWNKSAMRGTRLLKGEELEKLKQQADTDEQIDWHKSYKSANNEGIVDMDGKKCYKVVLEPKREGKPEIRYYDTETGLINAVETEAEMMSTPVHVLTKMSDYRDAGGIKMAFATAMDMSVNGMQIQQTVTLDKVEANVDIPNSKFEMPEDVKKLLESPSTEPAQKEEPGKEEPGK